jgi:hypothetical protein
MLAKLPPHALLLLLLQETIVVRMINAEALYGYEYLGNWAPGHHAADRQVLQDTHGNHPHESGRSTSWACR